MKDKRILSGQTAYTFTEHNDGIEMTDCQGFTTCYEDIMELCDGLMEYAYKHKVETVKKESKDGYVYLQEWGKYKIGFYKDDLKVAYAFLTESVNPGTLIFSASSITD